MVLFGAGAAGLVVGVGLSGVLAFSVSYVLVKKAELDARRGWNLVPVMVAARDLAPGEVVSLDALSLRSIPEQLATASIVQAESASYLANQPLLVGVSKGAPMRWSAFLQDESVNPHRDAHALSACWKEVSARGLDRPAKAAP